MKNIKRPHSMWHKAGYGKGKPYRKGGRVGNQVKKS